MTIRQFIESLEIIEKSFDKSCRNFVTPINNKIIMVHCPVVNLGNLDDEDLYKLTMFGWKFESPNCWEYKK